MEPAALKYVDTVEVGIKRVTQRRVCAQTGALPGGWTAGVKQVCAIF